MGHESLAHQELKKQAKEKLKQMGFTDSEIIEEYPINGTPRGFIIDVAGISVKKRVAIECGHMDELKKAVLIGQIGSIDKPFDEVIHMPYSEVALSSEFYDKGSPDLAEQKKYLVSVYNEEVYDKLKDDKEFQMQKCKSVTDPNFQIGRFKPWMCVPTATGTSGKKLINEINFVMFFDDNAFEIDVNAETNPAVKQFIQQMMLKDNERKLLDLFKRLPESCYIQVGYKFKDAKHSGPPFPRNWEDTKPYACNKLSIEQLDEIIKYLEFYLDYGSKFEQYPVIGIVCMEGIRKEDLSTVFKLLKPVYLLLFTLDTLDYSQAKEIRSIPDFEWYVDIRDYNKLLEKAQSKIPDITMDELKKRIRLIKKMSSDKYN